MSIKKVYLDTFSSINEELRDFNQGEYPIIWFRGQENRDWNVLPKIYRRFRSVTVNDKDTYGNLHLTEDYRYHSFRAKAGHQISTNPESVMEWMEIMQHHEVSTRLLDWTESMIAGLLFALEPLFLDSNDIGVNARKNCMKPVLWALLPQKLNHKVFTMITEAEGGKYPLIEKSLESLVSGSRKRVYLAEKIGHELNARPEIYFNDTSKNNISGLINLPALEEVRRIYGNGLLTAIENFEFNPFHFILLRLYSDRLVMKIEMDKPDKILPPLASIHQYHSQRIQAQKGVFLIVPHYSMDEHAASLSQGAKDLRAIEEQDNCHDAILKICILDHMKLAEELRSAGEHRYSNYPEVAEYARSIELSI